MQPRQQRSRQTHRKLLVAALECLAEFGWAGSTVAIVAHRAGVSRGAAQHHFPTREDLFSAALEFVTEERISEIREKLAVLPAGISRTEAVVSILLDLYTGPLFTAALHIWATAATNDELRARLVPLEARVGRAAHRAAVALLGVDESVPGAREAVQATLDLARGLGLANLLTDDSARRRGIAGQWARMLDATLSH
ncbi:MAG: TetR/AcrR family transcriptional regulator [Sciscionella sp.]|nr:TetR/AcrR family transcriptional regulator [Sciscionella sp.]